MKTVPELRRPRPIFSLHSRLPHNSPLFFAVSCVWRYKTNKAGVHRRWAWKMRRSVWAVLCFTPPSFVNSGSPERGVAQRGHSNSRDSLSTSRENLWKPILLDRPYRGFLCFVLKASIDGWVKRTDQRTRNKDDLKHDFIFLTLLVFFYKLKIQWWASEAFCPLCCLLGNSLITFSAEIVSLCPKTVNTIARSVLPVYRGASALPYAFLPACQCPLPIAKLHCNVIKPQHCPSSGLRSQTLYLPFGASAAATMKTNTFVSTADIELHQFQHPIGRHRTQ